MIKYNNKIKNNKEKRRREKDCSLVNYRLKPNTEPDFCQMGTFDKTQNLYYHKGVIKQESNLYDCCNYRKEMINMYKVIVAGSRTFNDYDLLENKLNLLLKDKLNVQIVSGTCYGADLLGEKYANKHKLDIKRFPADWNKYGKSAGYIRNKEMANYADACIVFWDGISRGTMHMINLAKDKGLKLEIVLF